ncbi:MAG: amidase family protein [Gemmatimonadota bacterium]
MHTSARARYPFTIIVSIVVTAVPHGLNAQSAAPMDVYEASIAELQGAMTNGRSSSVELVDAYLARIEAYDQSGPALNAILRINPAARTEAARLDRERAERGPRGPLHGIPIILKDNYNTFDLPTTGASIALATHRPATDAHQVARLRDAGAVILAKSNLHELAYGISTISSLGGQTRNPYDPRRNPGGSSGGTGAAIAASFAAVGWGSDTCGSIRIPAAVHNMFGLRPTKGLSSIAGILPLAQTQDTGGPLARSVMDLAISLDATIGADPADPATAALEGRTLPRFTESLDPEALEGARIGVLRQYFGTASEERETNRIVEAALEEMRGAGAEIVEIEIPEFDELLGGTSVIDYEFKWNLLDYLAATPEAPVSSLTEIIERGLHHEALTAILTRSDRHTSRTPAGLAEALAKRERAQAAVADVLDQHGLDALAYPTLRREAALIGEPALGNNCQLSATTGMPALTLPAGFSAAGIPVGLELLGRRFADDRLVALGYAYEQAVQPRRAPPTTPALIDGRAPTAIAFEVRPLEATTGQASGAVEFAYDPVTGSLEYEVRFPPGSFEAIALRRGSNGPILHRLAGPSGEVGTGTVALNAQQREALAGGELVLQVFGGSDADAIGEASVRLPQR